MARHNKTGRSSSGPSFVQLHNFMMEAPAWRSLSPQARIVYLEIARLYKGANNGQLALGVRTAAERAGVNKDTASKCFKALMDRGFIECAQPAAFNTNNRLAAEWRLTMYRCDRTGQAPTKAFMKWTPTAEQRPKSGTAKSETEGQTAPKFVVPVPSLRTIPGGKAVA